MAPVAGGCGQPCGGHGQGWGGAGRQGWVRARSSPGCSRSPSALGSGGIYPRRSPGMERGCFLVRGDLEVQTPPGSRVPAPQRCCACPSIPRVQKAASTPSPGRNSPNFSQKLFPARLAQRLESFALPCLMPMHHLCIGADGRGISSGPSFSTQSAWKNQNEDAELKLKPIFPGPTAASVGLGAAWDQPLAALPRQGSSVRNKP